MMERTVIVKLSGASPQSVGDVPPDVQVGKGGWQVQDDPADRRLDADADLDQPLAQSPRWGPSTRSAGGAMSEFLRIRDSSAVSTSDRISCVNQGVRFRG